MNSNIVILDTETSGLHHDAEIISLGLVDHNGNKIYHQYFKPQNKLSDDVIKIHKITNEFLSDKDPYKAHHNFIMQMLEGKEIWAYNSAFDSRMLLQTSKRYSLQLPHDLVWKCAMNEFNKRHNSQGKWLSLVNACKLLKINISDLTAHDAINDCMMTYRLLSKMEENLI